MPRLALRAAMLTLVGKDRQLANEKVGTFHSEKPGQRRVRASKSALLRTNDAIFGMI
jgi:hypothetical protein